VPEVNAGSEDRYEPLPGLLEIPGFLVRKIPPRARKPAAYAAGLLLVAVAVTLVLSIPAITESKDERAATEARQEHERRAQRAAELQAELRLREGRGEGARGLAGSQAITVRQALAQDLHAAVLADAQSRVRAGEFTQTVERVECERFPRGARGEDPAFELSSKTGRYSCLAITADAPKIETNVPSSIGYPYRALLHFDSGRFAYCKISGRPGEGSLTREFPVRIPPACGGDGP
jgi:hypothetical protein